MQVSNSLFANNSIKVLAPKWERHSLMASLAGGLLLAACGSNSGTLPSQSGIAGQEVAKPGAPGETFFVDPNQGGASSSLQIAEILFGRLVDIHDIDGGGLTNAVPIFSDFLVELDLLGSANYRLESNPLTGRERLVILAQRASDPMGFSTLLDQATDDLVSVVTRNDDGLDPGPFSSVPRNCSLSVRFNDMLSDGPADVAALSDNVKLLVGNLPSQPFSARMLFDPNFGALLAGELHSTRVIIDFAVSEAEAAASSGALMANTVGLPSGDNTQAPNVSIHIPTQLVMAGQSTIQLTLLRGISGVPLDFGNNGPASPNATLDVVRAFRPGNAALANNGFMPDNIAPEILGEWDVTVATANPDMSAGAIPGFDFLLDLQFDTACRSIMEVGDMLELGSNMLMVTADNTPDMSGAVTALEVRSLSVIGSAAILLGVGDFVSPLDPALTGIDGCWVNFSPQPATPITGTGAVAGISTLANLNIRFSEPIDPFSMSLLDRVTLMAGTGFPTALNRVAGTFVGNDNLDTFTLSHSLPFAHQTGVEDVYTLAPALMPPGAGDPIIEQDVPTDLAGNEVVNPLPPTLFSILSTEPANTSASLIFRFDNDYRDFNDPVVAGVSINEVDNPNSTHMNQVAPDFSGAFSLDTTRGEIRGRDVMFQSFVIDNNQNSVIPMIPPAGPLATALPLNPLGAKTQTLWRQFDMGMFSNQASSLDVDVVGINWAPIGGIVSREFFPNFEMRLGTSARIPDESLAGANLAFPDAGLLSIGDGSEPSAFARNVLGGAGGLVTVHQRTKGYLIRAIDRFIASTGLTMIAYPMNQNLAAGEPLSTFTWRNSADMNTSDPGPGEPTSASAAFYSGTLPGGNTESETAGLIHAQGADIQAAVLPLLMEFNCFASTSALGTNLFSIGAMAINNDAQFRPHTRIFSAGGINTMGFTVTINPDTVLEPSGGFSLVNGGAATLPADNRYYLGQLDTVFRVTRLVSHWVDLIGGSFTGEVSFSSAQMEPAGNMQPLGTSIQLEYRSAIGFIGSTPQQLDRSPFDPAFHGPNGDPVDHFGNGNQHSINFQAPNMATNTVDGSVWNADLTQMKSRFLQIRMSFINNIDAGTSPSLTALALPYEM